MEGWSRSVFLKRTCAVDPEQKGWVMPMRKVRFLKALHPTAFF